MFPTAPLPNATRLTVEDFPQPIRASTQIMDFLSEYTPGQKLIAEIQFQLANGAYRATIAQRDVTLALPFSAKPGDALELEVVETEGRVAFAVSRNPAEANKEGNTNPVASANTTLSRTGHLIGQLLQNSAEGQQKPAPLNAGEPVLKSPPTNSKDVAPALQQALSRSGLFYESHQAAWISGKLPESTLRQEPQAAIANNLQKFPGNATLSGFSPGNTRVTTHLSGTSPNSPNITPSAPPIRGATQDTDPRLTSSTSSIGSTPLNNLNSLPMGNARDTAPMPGTTPHAPTTTPSAPLPSSAMQDTDPKPSSFATAIGPAPLNKSANQGNDEPLVGVKSSGQHATQVQDAPPTANRGGGSLTPELIPLVQQQLTSLANNIYPFQGAIWPGQQIFWEIIDEEGGQSSSDPDDAPRQWKTRLKLLLPSLGEIDATLQLNGNDVALQMKSSETLTQTKLQSNLNSLRKRLDLAGLQLTTAEVSGVEAKIQKTP